MKQASPAYKSALLAGPLTLVDLMQVSLSDGTNLYYTALDRDVHYAGNLYLHLPGLMRSDIQQTRGVQVSRLQLIINYSAAAIDAGLNIAQSIMAQRWIGGTVTLLRAVNPMINADATATVIEAVPFFLGRVAQAKIMRSQAAITINSPLELFDMEMPWRGMSPPCRWTLFDVGCTLIKNNWGVPATILAGSTRNVLNLSIPAPAAWASGAYNAGNRCLDSNGNIQVAIVSGATGASAPVWATKVNQQTTDNAVTWLCLGAADFSGYFSNGTLKYTAGANAGLTASISSFSGTGTSSAYPTLVLDDAPRAYYRLNADVNDSANGYNGVNHGVTFSASGGPLAGGSGYGIFSGKGWIDISAIPAPLNFKNYLGGVSYEFFFNVTLTNQPDGLFGSDQPTSGGLSEGPIANFTDAQNTAPGFRWGIDHPYASFSPMVNQWVHCVAVFRGGRYIDIYLNGYLAVTVSGKGRDHVEWNLATLGKAVMLSVFAVPSTRWFRGDCAEMAIYAYAMDQSQVLTHYNASQTVPGSLANPTADLVLSLPNQPVAGDTVTLYPGCDRSMRACAFRFDNLINFGGTPGIPEPERGS